MKLDTGYADFVSQDRRPQPARCQTMPDVGTPNSGKPPKSSGLQRRRTIISSLSLSPSRPASRTRRELHRRRRRSGAILVDSVQGRGITSGRARTKHIIQDERSRLGPWLDLDAEGVKFR
eukprot:s6347_g3.t1